MYNKHCYLWDDNQSTMIEEFAATNPLTIDIREKFLLYDEQTAQLNTANKIVLIGSIMIDMSAAYNEFVEHSKTWKEMLGNHLTLMYKKKLDIMVNFIKDQEYILDRPIRDLDDVRLAMKCLDKIRENSIEYVYR